MSSKKNGEMVSVAVDLPVYKPYTYAVPEGLRPLILPGKRVLVPFGNRRVTGYILETVSSPESFDAKPIIKILDDAPLFPSSMLPFFRWAAEYYLYPLGLAMKSGLPGGLNLSDHRRFSLTESGKLSVTEISSSPEQEILKALLKGSCDIKTLRSRLKQTGLEPFLQRLVQEGKILASTVLSGGRVGIRMERVVSLSPTPPQGKLTDKRRLLLDILAAEGELTSQDLSAHLPGAARLIAPMAEAGWIKVEERPMVRDPLGEVIRRDVPPIPTCEQKAAIREVTEALGEGFCSFLLMGVTGSGKTEVYLQAAAAAMENGHSVLVLVPEIALISQMERRFRARFGETVAILHSGLSDGERFDQWRRIAAGEVAIAVGTRSAVFAPFDTLGLIIVDEEHDPSYKQETGFRYNGRDLAVMRAQQQGAVVLLGSATPAIQSFYNVQQKKSKLLTLSSRVEERPLPEISVVDLKTVRGKGGVEGYITPELHKAMAGSLSRGEQVLLFLNRRGYAGFPVCRACGAPVTCDRCDISLTLHRRTNAYKCHFCGFSRSAAAPCSACGSDRIKLAGIGTEKVEDGIRALFPSARVARMDRDSTIRKGSLLAILKGLKERSIDILIGTQMVAKGHDFPNITLVGVICADLSLSFPDFRAGERTFQLLAQVAGRAGRGDAPGKVVLQTYNPDHFSILSAKAQDFEAFYDHELGSRRALKYPPFSRLIQIRIVGMEKEKTEARALGVGKACRLLKEGSSDFHNTIDILGPIEAPLVRIADRFRWQILLKGAGVTSLQRFVRELMTTSPAFFSDPLVSLDVDPFDML